MLSNTYFIMLKQKLSSNGAIGLLSCFEILMSENYIFELNNRLEKLINRAFMRLWVWIV